MGATITGSGSSRGSRIRSSIDRGRTKAGQKKKSSKKSSKKGSGDKKLADYKAKHSSSGTSTPTIISGSEEEIKANQLITSSVGRSKGKDRTKEALQRIHEQESSSSNPSQNVDPIFTTLTPTVPTPLASNFNVPEADLPEGIEVLTGQTDWQKNSSSWDRTKVKIKDKLEPVSDAYNSVESSVSNLIPTLSENKQRDAEIMAELMSNSPEYAAAVEKMEREHPEQLEQTTFGNLYESAYEHTQEKPISTAAEIAAMYAGGYVIGAAGKVASVGTRSGILMAGAKVGSKSEKAGQVISSGERFVDPALAVVGTIPMVPTIVAAETTEERAELAFDFAVMGAGAMKGWKAGGDAIGYIQTRGRTEIPLDSITDVKVAEGVQDFPLTRRNQSPDEVMAEFLNSEHGIPGEEGVNVWHGTGGKFKETTSVRSEIPRGLESSDMPGMYVSPRASPNFTHVNRSKISEGYKLFGESEPISPEILRINVGDVGRMPTSARGKITEGRDFLLSEQAKPGEAYLTPNVERTSFTGKVEIEATITPKTQLTRVGQDYYTTIGSRRVPIDQFQAEFGVKGKGPHIEGNKPSTAREIAESMEYYNPNAKKGIIKSENIFSLFSESSPLSQIGNQVESELFSEKYREVPQSKIKSSRYNSSRISPRSSLRSSGGKSSTPGSSRSDPFPSSSVGSGSSRFNPFSDESSTAGAISSSRPPKIPPEFKIENKKGKVRRGKDQRNEEMRVFTKIQKFEDII